MTGPLVRSLPKTRRHDPDGRSFVLFHRSPREPFVIEPPSARQLTLGACTSLFSVPRGAESAKLRHRKTRTAD
jgi:hypothetical protein